LERDAVAVAEHSAQAPMEPQLRDLTRALVAAEAWQT
jgi:hypothetical protein